MKKYLVEFIGTFFLVQAVCLAGLSQHGAGFMAPIAIGCTLMVMVYAGGYVSGGHYNPAVSLAAFVRGKLGMGDLIGYWIVQLAAGAVAALVAQHVFKAHPMGDTMEVGKRALAAEVIGTFALAYVVLNTATSAKTAGNSNYGLAIGFTVVVMAYTLGPISGGAFNTAVALGATVFGGFAWKSLWIYVVGTLVGGLLAGAAYKVIDPDKD
jgi:aquaporin Z